MRVSQLTHAMDKDDMIVIDDYNAPIDNMTIYKGTVRGIKRDNPINQMHVSSICANNDTILVLVEKARETMQRAMGIIEGVSFGASERVQDALACVIDMLDDVLNNEESNDKG